MSRSLGDGQDLGHPVEGKIEVDVKDEHGAVLHRKPAEPALELVPIGHRASPVIGHRLVGGEQREVRRPTMLPPPFGVTGTNQEPIRPGVETLRITELGQVLPDADQRLLGRVVRQVVIPEDLSGHGQEPITDLRGKGGERPLVTVLGSNHEVGIHPSSISVGAR